MSKKIHTVQFSDKNEFDEKVNSLLEIGCELLENTYKVIENDDGVIYSQVVEYNTINTNIIFYNNGQLKVMGMYDENGNSDGLYTKWFENGKKQSEITYKDGEIDGLFTVWYENGRKKSENTWVYGKMDGLQTDWYENGNKKNQLTPKDNKPDGLWTQWYENGQKKYENNYKDGEVNYQKEWNKDGSVKE